MTGKWIYPLTAAALLAACGGTGDTVGDTGGVSGDDAVNGDDGAMAEMADGDTTAAWARQITEVCVGEAGETYRENCECMAEVLTEGRSLDEIAAITEDERQAAAAQCE